MLGLSQDLQDYIQAKKKQQDQLPNSELAGNVPTELQGSNQTSPPDNYNQISRDNNNQLTNDYGTRPRLVTTPPQTSSTTDSASSLAPTSNYESLRTQDYSNPPTGLSVSSKPLDNLGLLSTQGSQYTSQGGSLVEGDNPLLRYQKIGGTNQPMSRGKAALFGLLQGMSSASNSGSIGGLLGGAIAGATTGLASPDTIASINANQKLQRYYQLRQQAMGVAQEQAKLESTQADTKNKLNEPYFKNKEFDFKNNEYSRQLANDRFAHDTEEKKLTESARHNQADEQLGSTRNNLFADRTKQQATSASMKQPPDYEKSLADQAAVNAASVRKPRAQIEDEVFKYMQSVPEYSSNGKPLTKEDITYNKYLNAEHKRLVTEAQADNERQVKDKETSERNRLRQGNTGASPASPKGRLVPMYRPK